MRQWTVDAFASGPFKGNPAAVVEPFDAWPEASWMQALARENNQAETAYLLKTPDPARFGLRWFTPSREVPLCGHATLASGHVLASELGMGAQSITFDTKSGPLIVTMKGEFYEMDFPADPPRPVDIPDGLAEALGAEPLEVWAGQYLVALLESEQVVRDLEPNLAALHRIAGGATSGSGNLVVATFADPGRPYEVVSRFFAPGSGIPEDPATGSAHCILSPLFSDKLGQETLRFHQAYPGRGGDMTVTHNGPRVCLAGRAVTVIESSLRL